MFIALPSVNDYDIVWVDPEYIMKVDRGCIKSSDNARVTLSDGSSFYTYLSPYEVIEKIKSANEE